MSCNTAGTCSIAECGGRSFPGAPRMALGVMAYGSLAYGMLSERSTPTCNSTRLTGARTRLSGGL